MVFAGLLKTRLYCSLCVVMVEVACGRRFAFRARNKRRDRVNFRSDGVREEFDGLPVKYSKASQLERRSPQGYRQSRKEIRRKQ
jgi:hypothetical protein